MYNELMYIPNIDNQIYPFCRLYFWLKRLDTTSLEPINQNSIPKVFGLTNKKHKQKTLGTSLTNSPMSSPSLASTKSWKGLSLTNYLIEKDCISLSGGG